MVSGKKEESLCRHQSHKSLSFDETVSFYFLFFPIEFTISEKMAVWEEDAKEALFYLPGKVGTLRSLGPHLHILMNLNWKDRLN